VLQIRNTTQCLLVNIRLSTRGPISTTTVLPVSKPAVVSVVSGLPRPKWRGAIHAGAFWLALPAVVALIVLVDSTAGRAGATVFGISMLCVYGVSSAYHRLAQSPRAQRLMRRLDHAMIFVLIAGTYTPICLVSMPPPGRELLLAAVWGTAIIGIGLKTWGKEWLLRHTNALYIVMGWLGVAALPILFRTMSPTALGLMFAGGLLYTIGAVLFSFHRPDPIPHIFGYHEVWHLFTVLAGISHFAMVAVLVA